MTTPLFKIGDKVSKVGGDYTFDGVIVSVYYKLSGQLRYVAEDDRRINHIFSEKNLILTQPPNVAINNLRPLFESLKQDVKTHP